MSQILGSILGNVFQTLKPGNINGYAGVSKQIHDSVIEVAVDALLKCSLDTDHNNSE